MMHGSTNINHNNRRIFLETLEARI